MSKRITVKKDKNPIYDIVIEQSYDGLSAELETIGASGKKLCIVTDSNVAPLYRDMV